MRISGHLSTDYAVHERQLKGKVVAHKKRVNTRSWRGIASMSGPGFTVSFAGTLVTHAHADWNPWARSPGVRSAAACPPDPVRRKAR
jgi:hypothetical protein